MSIVGTRPPLISETNLCWINFHLQGEGMRRSGGYAD